jgi:transposase InsO family protein
VFIHHEKRVVSIVGVTAKPVAERVTQQARNLSMEVTDQAMALKFLIRDRDTKFTASFDAVFAAEGIKTIKSPVRAPRAHAICERVIGTLRRESLDRILILGLRHLEAVLRRVRRALQLAPPTSVPQPAFAVRSRDDSGEHR